MLSDSSKRSTFNVQRSTFNAETVEWLRGNQSPADEKEMFRGMKKTFNVLRSTFNSRRIREQAARICLLIPSTTQLYSPVNQSTITERR